MTARTKVAAVAVMAALAGASGAANAYTVSQSTTGASVYGSWNWVSYDSGKLVVGLKDTGCDSHSVYFLMHADGYSNNRWENNNGCGSTLNISNVLTWPDYVQYGYSQVCRDVQLNPDNCSSTARYLNPYY